MFLPSNPLVIIYVHVYDKKEREDLRPEGMELAGVGPCGRVCNARMALSAWKKSSSFFSRQSYTTDFIFRNILFCLSSSPGVETQPKKCDFKDLKGEGKQLAGFLCPGWKTQRVFSFVRPNFLPT